MSKELTDAWINNKMEAGSIYFVKVKDGYGYRIEPMVVDMDGDLSDLEGKRYMPYASQNDILEIISLCDYETLYEELQNLRSLLKECKDAYQIYIPLFKMLKNEEAVKTAVNLANKIGEVID